MSKKGEGTEELEMYVSAFLSMKWKPSCRLSKILYENLMSNNFRKTCIHLLGGDTVTSMTGISFNLNFIPIKGYKLDINHTVLISQWIDLFLSSYPCITDLISKLGPTIQDKTRQYKTIKYKALQYITIRKGSRTKNINKQTNKQDIKMAKKI